MQHGTEDFLRQGLRRGAQRVRPNEVDSLLPRIRGFGGLSEYSVALPGPSSVGVVVGDEVPLAGSGFESHAERLAMEWGAQNVRRYIARWQHKRDKKGELSPSHGMRHISTVANYAPLIAEALGATRRQILLTEVAAWMHDVRREPNEVVSHGKTGADHTDWILNRQDLGFEGFSHQDRAAIHNAIASHESTPAWWSDEATRDRLPKGDEIVQVALRVADRLDSNGGFVLAKRTQLVKERLGPKGDMMQAGLSADEPLLAVALMNFQRLRQADRPENQPAYLRPLTDPMFRIQMDFHRGLLASLRDNPGYASMTEDELGDMSVRLGLMKGDAVDSIKKGLPKTEAFLGGVDEDLKASAREVVSYFFGFDADDINLQQQIFNWQPEHAAARLWKKDMVDTVLVAKKQEFLQKVKEGVAAAKR
jgi:hypothetical protein